MEVTVFLCGASTMILELAGSRALAPYVGTSIYVWTSLIGVILAALSLGYWWGGRLSDKHPDRRVFSSLLFTAALWIAGISYFGDIILVLTQAFVPDIRLEAVVSTLALFAVPSVFLGAVLPYAVRFKISAVGHAGSTVGNLYALSTIGSIAGTFAAGFYFIAYWNNASIFLFISSVLILASALLYVTKRDIPKFFILVFFALTSWQSDLLGAMVKGKALMDTNTRYNRVWIYPGYDPHGGASVVRLMQVNDEMDSGMFLNSDELAFDYTRYFRLAEHFNPALRQALMIGGGAYSYPKEFLRRYPAAQIDVVEIDPGLTALARKFFRLADNPRLTIYHEDARTFLNRSQKKYDVIYGDVFRSYSIPFQLTTKEAVLKIRALLNDDGAVLLNIVSAVEGDKGQFFRAEYATYKSVFPQVLVYSVGGPDFADQPHNLILVALKSKNPPESRSPNKELDYYLHFRVKDIPQDAPLLTDKFAPVERYSIHASNGSRKDSSPVFARWKKIWEDGFAKRSFTNGEQIG